jgi:hypothetical protein
MSNNERKVKVYTKKEKEKPDWRSLLKSSPSEDDNAL